MRSFPMPLVQSRRRFLTNVAFAGAAGLGGLAAANLDGGGRSVAAEPPPETTTFRIQNLYPNVCVAPQYVAEELLRAEGFSDIRYVELTGRDVDGLGHYTPSGYSKLDFNLDFAPDMIAYRDAGAPITPL